MPRSTEQDTGRGRLGRYARVGAQIGGVAVRAAGGRLIGRERTSAAAAADLRRALGGLKGPVMKVAQMLATIPQALPPEYAGELSKLQSHAASMGPAFVARRMAAELGPDWRDRFADFDVGAAAAASLGQVHRATDTAGRSLACKLQYPMASAVEADLRQLAAVFALYRRVWGGVDTRHVLAEIGARLREELDYGLEARHMRLYGALLRRQSGAGVRVPEPVPELSTGRLLTMAWLEGRPMHQFEDAPEATRNALAERLFRAWYGPFYGAGTIHGDPHLGNYSVDANLDLNLLDFGCVRTFQPKFVQGVIDLYRAVRDNDVDLAAHTYRTWGFERLSGPVIDALNLWARFLYEPLLDDRARFLREDDGLGVFGHEVAVEVHTRLRNERGVVPPREFVFMDRAAVGLGAVFLRLRARLNWHRLFHELVEGFDPARLARKQATAFAEAGVPLP